MSLINDALKRARQNAPEPTTPPVLKMAPEAEPLPLEPTKKSAGPAIALVSIIILALIGAGVFWMGRATAHQPISAPPAPTVQSLPVPLAAEAQPPAAPSANPIPKAAEPAPALTTKSVSISASDLPRVQGIFYVPGQASAILDGKTVRKGDPILGFRVKEITKSSVILVDAAGQSIALNMGN